MGDRTMIKENPKVNIQIVNTYKRYREKKEKKSKKFYFIKDVKC